MQTCAVIKNTFKEDIATECKGRYCYIGSKLSRKFNMEDKTAFEEQHDLLYRAVCAINNCTEDYVGESARRIVETAKDHNGRDQDSNLVKRVIENNHLPVVKDEFTKLESGYRNNTHKRKIAEALIIKVIRKISGIKTF